MFHALAMIDGRPKKPKPPAGSVPTLLRDMLSWSNSPRKANVRLDVGKLAVVALDGSVDGELREEVVSPIGQSCR